MPVPIPSKTEDGALPGQGRYMEAVGDDELGLVAGGQQFIFRGEGFQRDSWFVTFMLKRMIQDSVRQQDLTRTLDAAPQYNSSAIGYLNAGMVDLSAVTVTSCDITYPGSTMKLRINPSGYVVTADYHVPFVVEAAGKAMFISAEVTCEGSDTESWVLNW